MGLQTLLLVAMVAVAPGRQDPAHDEGPARGADERRMEFAGAEQAFARAAEERKRVLVYQDWPT